MRQLRIGEDVLAKDGTRLGRVERIVVDEAARAVTHLVVRGRAVEISRFSDAGPDGLATEIAHSELETFPDADLPPFGAPGEHWEAPAGYSLDAFATLIGALGALVGQGPFRPPVHADLGGEVHEITEGSPVWAGDLRLGEVDRVLSDESGRLAAIVVRQGGRRRRVPAERVAEVHGNNVHLDTADLDAFPEFDPLREA